MLHQVGGFRDEPEQKFGSSLSQFVGRRLDRSEWWFQLVRERDIVKSDERDIHSRFSTEFLEHMYEVGGYEVIQCNDCAQVLCMR